MPDNINQATIGLNTDSIITQIQPGQLTYALNAMVEGFDGSSVSYQSEQSNTECVVFPEGYKVVGVKNVTSIDTVYYWLANPTTNASMIGYSTLNSCVFNILLDDTISGSDPLGFRISASIPKIEVKTTNCSTQLYWTDGLNPRRYIDLNNLPWKESLILGIITPLVGQIDANKLLVQPNFAVPTLLCTAVSTGGTLVEGTYQFAIQYSDILGNGYTGFYSVTNEVRIFLDNKISPNFNETTSKAITVSIDNLDTTGLYDYFNLAVIKTINAITSVELVGTFPISENPSNVVTYAGTEYSNANIKLTINDIFEQKDYYDMAGCLTQVDNVLVWANLTKEDDISYQQIWNQVTLQWEAWRIPDSLEEGYTNGVTCANRQGYMRDEVYAFEGCFILANGKQTTRCHIPGRYATPADLITITDPEAIIGASQDPCNPTLASVPVWKVYNTASVIGFSPGYVSGDSCYNGPYQYGDMSYWQSTELYPNNSSIWGSLANTPIRHHKFPDSTVIHIHDQNPNIPGTDQYNQYQHAIFPIGVKIDIVALRNAIQSSTSLTQQQKDQIVGFKIMRGDRINNQSIIAKGMFYNCGMYTKPLVGGSNYFYPNYPFNDLNPDPFISSSPVAANSGANSETLLNDFQGTRFTFHSPDTHFYRPTGIAGGFVKLETATYGMCKSHFVPVLLNAGEKLRTIKDLEIALAGGVASIVGLQGDYNFTVGSEDTSTTGVAPSFHAENFFPAFNSVLDIVDKLIPYTNYGWQYNGVGYYGNYKPITTIGEKIRAISYGGYINPGLQGTFGDVYPINNTNRESSVYVSLNAALPYINPITLGIPADNSRVIASQVGMCGSSANFYRNIASYYGAIKQYIPGQYGQIFTYKPIDTGCYSLFVDDSGVSITNIPTVFGGDVFINRFALKRKHSFYLKDTVNKQDGTDVDYNQDLESNTNTGNVGYPIWYYSTSNTVINVDNTALNNALNEPVIGFIPTLNDWVTTILLGGIPLLASAMRLLITLIKDGILTSLGIKLTNMDCANNSGIHETGQAYLYAYGIPYYYCESEVNVSMRQATNIAEGDFFPQVSNDIPDAWLQQTNVPIIYDNTYTYNKTYSKENKETYFATLRPDWTPNNPCYTNFNNRAIWSDKSNLEETKNHWLIYRPGNTFDFPKGYGLLQSIDSLKNNEVLVRFHDKTQKYNAQTAIQITQGPAAYVGSTQMFAAPPIDLIHSDTGRAGSQNSLILKTDFGNVFVDAKRGSVFMLGQQQSYFDAGVQDLSEAGMSNWFRINLPFQILNYFPTIDTDNIFNGIGLTGVYDTFYKRILLTKQDAIPLSDQIQWDGTNFYISIDLEDYKSTQIISIWDPQYFCNKSWTVSFSFKTKSWTSWHSYIPNFYVQNYTYFQSGRNDLGSTWTHSYQNVSSFCTYFGTEQPYILEYPFAYKEQDEILQGIKDFTTVRVYQDYLTFYEPDATLYFNKAIIYNGQQCTGILQLIPRPLNNLSAYNTYPIYNTDSKSIIVTKSDNFYNYNTFWDVVASKSQPIFTTGCDMNKTDKDINQANMNYTNVSRKKPQIRAKDVKIRHILDNNNTIRLVSKFILNNTVPSYK